MSPRVVLDTNVVVSALLFERGRLAWIRHGWLARRFVPLASHATIRELVKVLAYPKFQLSPDEAGALLVEYASAVETVTIEGERGEVSVPDPPDPDDRPFLELACAGEAEFLVTGDADLLKLEAPSRLRIVSPADFQRLVDG